MLQHVLAVFVCGQLFVWGLSVTLALVFQQRQRRATLDPVLTEPVSIVVLLSGLDREEATAVESVFAVNDVDCEVVFVAEHEHEPVVDLVRKAEKNQVVAGRSAALVYGRDGTSANPKLDSLKVGFKAAKYDVVALVDGNVSLPADFLARVRAGWQGRDSVVTALPLAVARGGFWSTVEAVWINNIYWRWVSAGWVLGIPACMGKLLVFRKSWLETHGGVARLGQSAAEDGALAELATATRTPIRPIDAGFALELHQRRFTAVISRARRWAVIRRKDRPGVFTIELLNTLASALCLSALWMHAAQKAIWPVWVAILLYWHALEAVLSVDLRQWRPRVHLDALVRDCLTVPIWLAGWLFTGYVWRGRAVKLH